MLLVLTAVCAAAVSCGDNELKEKNEKTLFYDEASGISYNLYVVAKKVSDGKKEFISEYSYAGIAGYNGELANVAVPDKITAGGKEYPVTLVEAMAFSNVDSSKASIKSIVLPASVTTIFDGAFEANASLEKVTMPGVTTISAAAFKDCVSLKKGGFTLPDNIETIEARAFSGAFVLSDAEIENGTGTYKLVLPDSLKKLGSDAFGGCSAITEIEIGRSLSSFGSKAFADCANIKNITVSADNPSLTSVNGVVYSKDMTALLLYSPAREDAVFEIPSSVKTLSGASLQDAKYLEKLVIPDGVTAIPDSFAAYAFMLREISGGSGVRSVGQLAFAGCVSLEKIGFIGEVTSFDSRALFGCSSLKSLELNGALTEIPDGCFSGCESLTSVTIPQSVATIGIGAFSGCESLTSAVIPDSVKSVGNSAFSYCRSLTSATLPASITEVPQSCFYSDGKLETVVLKGTVTAIGDSAFKSCESLRSVLFENRSDVTVSANAFAYCKSLETIADEGGSEVKLIYIGDSAFSGCEKIAAVKAESAAYVGSLAFSNCKSLNSVVVNADPGSFSFRGCVSLKSVEFGDAVRKIADSAFYGCSQLSRVTFGVSLSTIGEKAFAGCTSLEFFDVSERNGTFISRDGVLFCDGGKTLSFYPCGKKDVEYAVPDKTATIADGAFSGAEFLEKVTLSNDTVTLGAEAFSDCTALRSAGFGGITKIPKKAFSGCTGLREITITDEKIFQIGYGAFSGCTGLEKVTVGANVTSMNTASTVDTISFAFVGCDFEKLTFYTPKGSYFESQLLRIGGLNIVNY